MSPAWKTKTVAVKMELRKILIPFYIILSSIFILYVLGNLVAGVVYKQWVQEWYKAAISELIVKVEQRCEPVPVNFWEKQIEVINLACLQSLQSNPEAQWE